MHQNTTNANVYENGTKNTKSLKKNMSLKISDAVAAHTPKTV